MKKVAEIRGYLPSTTDSAEQQAAQDFIVLVTDIATGKNGKVDKFSFSEGVAQVEIDGDEAITAVESEFSATEDVIVEMMSPVQAVRKLNIRRQAKIDKMAATKAVKKAGNKQA